MSKELENIEEKIMEKIRKDELKMRPKIYFVIGSIITFIGLISSIIFSVFLIGVMKFLIRSNGHMGSYKLERMTSSFPWWIPILAVAGLFLGLWLVRRYDFSYKIKFRFIVIAFIITTILGGWIIDTFRLNNIWMQRGPMNRVMRKYIIEEVSQQKTILERFDR